MEKVTFKGNGNVLRGKKIISELERLGGINTTGLQGNSNLFYFIDDHGRIWGDIFKPRGHKLSGLPTKPFESLEQAAKNYKDLNLPDDLYDAFIAGAKWKEQNT